MNFKSIIGRTLLTVGIVSVGAWTAFSSVFCSHEDVPQNKTVSVAENTEDEINHQIIVNAVNYLELTSCENIDEVPEIDDAVEPVQRMVIDISDEDIYLMACQVYVEAGIEPYDGKIGVANVIINRVKSSRFPDTVPGVIYQSGQFPPAHNGVLDRVLSQGPGEECMRATMDALYGASTVGDYLFFNMSCGVNTSKCSRYMQIGDTIFYMPND